MRPESSDSEEIRRFEEHYRRNPDSLAFARLADAHRKAGEPARALEVLDEGIRRHPDYPSAHIVRARTLIDLGRPDDAGASLHRVLEIDARSLVAMRELAGLAELRGAPHEAEGWHEQIVALDPLNAESVQALERLRSARTEAGTPATPDSEALPEEADDGGSGGAAWWFEDPGESEPSDDGDLLTRTMAELYVKQGLLGEAAAIYRELLSDRPDDVGLGEALADVERRMEAPPPAAPRAPAPPAAGDSAATRAARGDTGRAPPPRLDTYSSHDVPVTAATSDMFRDWIERLRE